MASPIPSNAGSSSTTPATDLTKISVKIGGKDYLMTVLIDNKPIHFTDKDAETVEKMRAYANELFAKIKPNDPDFFNDKVVKTVNETGIYDAGGLIHEFGSSNSQWDNLQAIIRTFNAKSSDPSAPGTPTELQLDKVEEEKAKTSDPSGAISNDDPGASDIAATSIYRKLEAEDALHDAKDPFFYIANNRSLWKSSDEES